MKKKIEYIGILKSFGSPVLYQIFFKITGKYSINITISDNLAIAKARVRPNTYKYGWKKLYGYKTFILPDPVRYLVIDIYKNGGLFVSNDITTDEQVIFSAYFQQLIGDV